MILGGSGKPRPYKKAKTWGTLMKIENERKIYISGLPKGLGWQALQELIEQNASKPKLTEIVKFGVACVAFATGEEASNAVAVLQGAEINGQTIEVDMWTGGQNTKKKKWK